MDLYNLIFKIHKMIQRSKNGMNLSNLQTFSPFGVPRRSVKFVGVDRIKASKHM